MASGTKIPFRMNVNTKPVKLCVITPDIGDPGDLFIENRSVPQNDSVYTHLAYRVYIKMGAEQQFVDVNTADFWIDAGEYVSITAPPLGQVVAALAGGVGATIVEGSNVIAGYIKYPTKRPR